MAKWWCRRSKGTVQQQQQQKGSFFMLPPHNDQKGWLRFYGKAVHSTENEPKQSESDWRHQLAQWTWHRPSLSLY